LVIDVTREAGLIPQSDPTVSVITPALNAAATLPAALQSLAQQSASYEAILIDGGSADDTVAIALDAPKVRVVSAPGTSIYEAINRGIAEARAPAICLLNADDTLVPGALATLADALSRHPEAGIARGRPRFVELDARGVCVPRAEVDQETNRPLSIELLLRGPCAINSLCIRREVFTRVGSLDPEFSLAADRDWMLRAHLAGIGITEVDQPVYRYLIHAGSSTLDRDRRNFALIRREHLAIAARHLLNIAEGSVGPFEHSVVTALKRWHAAETAMLCRHLGRHGEWGKTGTIMHRAFRIDPYWPATLIMDVFSRVTRHNRLHQ
jgi:glycosyltransferase involved in cell wall biosynthesis